MNANLTTALPAGDPCRAAPVPAEERPLDLDQLSALPVAPAPPPKPEGVVVGVLAALDAAGPHVDFPDNPRSAPVAARATVALGAAEVGRAVALFFENGDWSRPLIMGLLHEPRAADSQEQEVVLPGAEVEVDGKRLVLTGQEQVVLRCGKASITLTKAGKIILRGTYVLSRSEGVNSIKGATVHIN